MVKEDQVRTMVHRMPTLAWACRPDGTVEFLNQRWLDYTGLPLDEALDWAWKAAIHPNDLATLMDSWLRILASGEPGEAEARLRRSDGKYRWFLFRAIPVRDEHGKVTRWYGTNSDIEDLKRAQSLLSAEKRTLEMITGGAKLSEILDELCRMIDAHASDAFTTIFLLDSTGGYLVPGAGPGAPSGWFESLCPLKIGPSVGSCGTAAFLKQRVITSDVATDPLWANFLDVALQLGVRASWSQPLLTRSGDVLGTFAMCFSTPREPSDSDLQLIDAAGHIAVIAIERKRTEDAAQASQARFEGILAIAQDGIISTDSHQRVILFNQGAEKIFGYAQAEVLGRPLDMLLPQHLHDVHRKHIAEFAGSPEIARTMGQRREVSGRRKDGSDFPAEASISKLDFGGQIVFTVILRDITKRKRAEQRLVTQHTVAQVLAAASSLTEATPGVLQAVCDCLSWDLGELWRVDRVREVLRCVEVWHHESTRVPQFVAAGSTTTFKPGVGLPGRVWSSRQPIYVADVVEDDNFPRASVAAREGLHAAFAFPILLGREVVGVMAFFSREIRQPDQDLLDMMATIGSQIGQFIERKNAEEALRESMQDLSVKQELLDLAQRAARAMAFDWYIQQPVNKWSPEQEALYGLAPASFDGTYKSWKKLIHPDDWPLVLRAIRHAQETGEVAAEFRVVWPNGSTHWLATNGQMFFDADRRPFRMVGFTTDVTARKLVEEDLRRSEAYLAEGQRLSRTGSFGWNVATGEIFWSVETFCIFGYEKDTRPTLEMMTERTHPDDRAFLQHTIDRARQQAGDFDFEHRLLMPDGSIKYLHVVARASTTGQSSALEYVGAVMDVTEFKRVERMLRSSEADLHEAQRLSHTGSWKHDLSTGKVTVSPEVHRIFDVQPDEDVSRPQLYFNRIHPEDRARVEALFERCERQQIDYEADYRIVLPKGNVRYQHAVGRPILNEAGDLIEFVGTTIDTTEQVQSRVALEKALQEIRLLKDQLHNENVALREEIDHTSMFEEIVGSSAPLRAVLQQVTKVATADSTVLIFGETGTGKELIARAIHRRSTRSAQAFIRVNCAAIPTSLIASELFGHEKGAFTGALQRRIGRFEAANGGTIFLDEIGELPMETQVALLRVLQEREFERIGGGQPIRVDVRVLAATNRDLRASVTSGAFRQDLFYRLNVFPVQLPSLRERRDDIPILVEYLIDRFGKKAGKRFTSIDKRTLELLQSYSWPGNVRELQNVVERAVIVCEDGTFLVDETWLKREVPHKVNAVVPLAADLADHERERIETALAECGGRISGPTGAAARLGIPRQTLESKIRSLGINKQKYKAASAD